MNIMKKDFLVQKMDELCRNAMLHQILSDRHLGTFSKSKKKRAARQSLNKSDPQDRLHVSRPPNFPDNERSCRDIRPPELFAARVTIRAQPKCRSSSLCVRVSISVLESDREGAFSGRIRSTYD